MKELKPINLEDLPNLPERWCWINFYSVIRKIKRGPSLKCNQDGRGIRYITSGNLENGKVNLKKDFKFLERFNEIDRCKLLPGDLILNCVNSLEQIGKFVVFEASHGEAIVGFNNYALELNLDMVLPKYINFVCQSKFFRRQIYFMIKRAVNQVSFATDELERIAIPLLSISEQRRIVSKLEELFTKLDAGIEYLKKNQILLKQYRQSVLKYGFEGKLTEEWRSNSIIPFDDSILRGIEKEQIDKKLEGVNVSKLPKLPSLWKWVKLGDVYNITMGQSPPGNCYNYEGNGMPLLNGPTEFGETYPTTVQWTNKITKISEKNDLLICVRGNTTGRMNWSNQKYCIGRGLASIRPKFPTVNNKILFFFLQMKTKELISNTTGSTFPNLTRDKLTNFLFPLIPNDEQIYIVNDIEKKISIIKNMELIIKHHLTYLIKLRNSILKYAFEGKLVPQDPTDESAEILLDKIKRERESTIPIKKEKSKITKKKSIDIDNKQMRLM